MNKDLEEVFTLVAETVSNLRLVNYDDEQIYMTLFTMGVMGLFRECVPHPVSNIEEVRDILTDLIQVQYMKEKERDDSA